MPPSQSMGSGACRGAHFTMGNILPMRSSVVLDCETCMPRDNPRQVQLVEGTDYIRLSGIDFDEVIEVVDCNPAAENLKFLSFGSIQQTYAWDAICLALARRTLPEGAEGFDIYARTL